MTIDKIIVGDDQIDFAKQNFPYIPNVEVDFVDNPNELVSKVIDGDYSVVVTDLNYTPNGEEGFSVLEQLSEVDTRKILWTGNAYDPGIKSKGQSLGAEVLDKDELGAIVGQIVSHAPLKEDGKVLVYVSGEGATYKAVEKVIGTLCDDNVVVTNDLKAELPSCEYGLVIDTSPAFSNSGNKHGVVAHDMKYIKMQEVPRVTSVCDYSNIVADVVKVATEYLNQKK